MKYIAVWATAGFLVASAWAIYFLVATKGQLTQPIVSTLIQSTCPIAILGSHYPVSVSSTLLANIGTYALIGLVVETLRRQFNHSN
jgi:hypothetical protein